MASLTASDANNKSLDFISLVSIHEIMTDMICRCDQKIKILMISL